MPVSVDSPDLKALVRKLGTVSKDAPKAFSQALSSVGRAGKTETKRAASAHYNVAQKRVEEGVSVRQQQDAVVIRAARKPITLRIRRAPDARRRARYGNSWRRSQANPQRFQSREIQRHAI